MARNVLYTKTGCPALISVSATILLGVCLHFSEPMQKRFPNIADLIEATSNFVIDIAPVIGAGGGIASIAGRMSATSDVYSPRWMPGRNKEDAERGG